MADALGLSSMAAFRKDPGEETGAGPKTYPHTPVDGDLGANKLIPFDSESLTKAIERSVDPALLGSHAVSPAPIILHDCTGGIGGRLRYNGWARMFLCAMGFEYQHTTLGSPKALTNGYAHLFELDDALQDQAYLAGEREAGFHADDRKVRRGQIGLAKTVEDWIFGSCMFNKMTISGNPSEVRAQYEVTPYELYRGDYSSDTWTVAANTESQALFQQCVVSLARRSDTPGSMTEIQASGFEIAVENSLKTDDRTTTSSPNIIIPVRDSFKAVTLKLERPRYSTVDAVDETMIDYFQQDQEFSAMITITGPLIGGTDYYLWRFCMPSLRAIGPLGPANIEGPGPLTQEWNFQAYRPITTDPFAATLYDGITVLKDSELVVVHHNEENVNYLTEI